MQYFRVEDNSQFQVHFPSTHPFTRGQSVFIHRNKIEIGTEVY